MSDSSRGFCIFYDWFEVFEKMSISDVAKLVLAIGRYYRDGSDGFESVSKNARAVAVMIRGQLERMLKRKKKSTAALGEGDIGGGVYITETQTQPKTETETEAYTQTQPKTKTETEAYIKAHTERGGEGRAYGNVLCDFTQEDEGQGGSGILSEGILRGEEGAGAAFTSGAEKPTLSEIEEYVRENGIKRITPKEFYDCNEERGWRVEGEPVRDWRRLIDSWERNRPEKAAKQEKPKGEGARYGDFDVNEAFELALKRSYGDLG